MLAHAGGWDEMLFGLAGALVLLGIVRVASRWTERRRRKVTR